MKRQQVIVSHSFYKSQVVVDGWLVVSFYGPFHRHRCLKKLEACKIEAELIYIKETEAVNDNKNLSLGEWA